MNDVNFLAGSLENAKKLQENGPMMAMKDTNNVCRKSETERSY
jgi:hypothetical protein